ncbi:4a-hydroxytetrahydrobiopterin dehydratase [Solicola gregarius]|uniref:Putative pterin-4-alpha-carbinolamine dehydratase n=1 Tax=Solicola gregarius TaxID=2908642 RepID=A0AA46YKW0_9ACTN|nr:4a-hydroxytetrahydrobiopterin dehydratase [Solicola gregarius]UYM06210.1 4a-hydroxytetrahydrobiopterin dehydratase [Solicola gregarius]
MSDILSSEQLHNAMAEHPHWEVREGKLVRSVQASSFPKAIQLVDAVAERAEAVQHHPDIDIRWTTVTFALTTHSEGGITAKDVEMAAQIDELIG